MHLKAPKHKETVLALPGWLILGNSRGNKCFQIGHERFVLNSREVLQKAIQQLVPSTLPDK